MKTNNKSLKLKIFKAPLYGESSEINKFLSEHNVQDIKSGGIYETTQGSQLIIMVLYND